MIPGDEIPESLAQYEQIMRATAKRLRERDPESVAAVMVSALADLAHVVAQELERRDGEREDWQR